MRIFTIGYEGATQPEVVAALTRAGVTLLADIRAVPLSRRPGFCQGCWGSIGVRGQLLD